MSLPPTNHLANGGFDQSSVSVGSVAQVSRRGLLGPEAEPVRLGLLVRLRGDVGVRGQLGRRREPALLLQQVGQAALGLGVLLDWLISAPLPSGIWLAPTLA